MGPSFRSHIDPEVLAWPSSIEPDPSPFSIATRYVRGASVSLIQCLFTLLLSVMPALSQTASTGALTVTATDQSGAGIVGATVTLSNTAGFTRTQVTQSYGSITFTLLAPGPYKVAISEVGFKTIEVPSVAINVTETGVLTQRLEIGTQQQSVSVTADAQATQTESSTVGTVVDGRAITELPLVTRNYTQILSLSPGVITDVYNASTVGRGSQDFTVNGSSNISNSMQINGAGVTSISNGEPSESDGFEGDVPIPSPDAIQEFKVQTSGYDAGYGRNVGGNVNLILKSGSNDIHGSLFEFLRNNALDANGFFQNESGIPKGELRQNQFGGTIGGPIKTNKLFYFLSYQGTRQLNGIASTSLANVSVPEQLTNLRTAAALGSEFCPQNNPAGSPGAAYSNAFNGNPSTPLPTSDQVACNGSNISPVALAYLNAKTANGQFIIPTPQVIHNAGGVGAIGSAAFSIPAAFNEDQALADLDYVISEKHRFSGTYFYSSGIQTRPFQGSGNSTLGSGADNGSGNHLAVAKLTSILTNTLVNEARFSYYFQRASLNSTDPLTLQELGITGLSLNGWYNIPPVVSITGLMSIGGGATDGVHSSQWNYEWSDQMSWTRGRHSMRFGYGGNHFYWPWDYYAANRGGLTFQTWADFLLGMSAAQNGTTFSNVYTSSGTQTAIGGEHNNNEQIGMYAFFQDDFKVSQRLTLNLGVRWEYDGTFYDGNGQLMDAWWGLANTVPIPPSTGTFVGYTVASNYPGAVPSGIFQRSGKVATVGGSPLRDFGPRAGFAWQPLGTSGRFVVRGGFGIFYNQVQGNPFAHEEDTNPPLTAQEGFSGVVNAAATFQMPWTANRSLGFTPSTLRTLTSGLITSGPDEYLVPPESLSYNLNLQYEVKPSWVVEIGYVGVRGERLATEENFDVPELATPSNPVNCGLPIVAAAGPQNAQGCVLTNTAANAAYRVPVMGYSPGGFQVFGNFGDSEYNSVQATLRKRFSHGLQFQASYTYGRTFTDVAGVELHSEGGSVNSNDPNSRTQQWGPADYTRPQRLVINYTYELPNYHDGNGLAGRTLSGWGLSGVTVAQQGEPMTLTDPTGGLAYGGAGTSRAQLCPGMTYANLVTPGSLESKLSDYFNLSAVADTTVTKGLASCALPIVGAFAAAGTSPASAGATGFGNTGRAILLGPGQFNWDISINKKTRVGGLRESAMLEFRAEFFNAFNHSQFSNPGTTVTSGFGVISSTSVASRIIQFGLRYAF
jgi:hypothetical protein